MGLVVAGTLSDYRDAERAPTDLAAGLNAILREAESFERAWGKPNLSLLRERLIAVVTTLRSDINAGNTRDCQAAIEEVSSRCWSWRRATSRRTTSSACVPSRRGCASRCCASTTSSASSSCRRRRP